MVSVDDYWNTIPLFILFREAIEASIIVSVLITFCRRMNASRLEKQVWWGVGLGVVFSLAFGIIFICLYYMASQNLFQGSNQMFFKAAVSWVACLMVTVLAFAMLRFLGWEDKWKRRLEAMALKQAEFAAANKTALEAREVTEAEKGLGDLDSESSNPPAEAGNTPDLPKRPWYDPRSLFQGQQGKCSISSSNNDSQVINDDPAAGMSWKTKNAFFIAIFLTVLREGLESVIFLAGVGNAKPTAILLPGIVGIICGVSVGIILYYSGKSVNHIKWLLIGMAVVLFFIAAGQFEMGADYLMKGGSFGTYYSGPLLAPASSGGAAFADGDEIYSGAESNDGYRPVDIRPWWMIPLWDISYCCSDQDSGNKFLSLSRQVVGYNATPAYVDVVAYCGYWVVVIFVAAWKFYKRTLFDADFKHNKMMREQAEAAEKEAAMRAKSGEAPGSGV